MCFQDKIRFIRESLGLSQKELAIKLGVAFATVNRWEQGLTTPQPNMEKKIDDFCMANNIIGNKKRKIGLELISATQIENWFANNQRTSQDIFPELVQNLIKETLANNPSEIRFPHGDKINSDGFDGKLKILEFVSTYIPVGESVWELGATTKTPANKIIDDYKKRDKNTGAEEKEVSTFILVTPASLSTASFNKIQKEIKTHSWKEVRVYTSIELCDWLSNCLATTIWFYKVICGKDLLLDTLASAHNKLKASTTPQLSSKIFTASRKNQIDELIEAINNKKVIKIAGPSFYESYGFVLSAMIESNIEENNMRTVICNDYTSLQKINALTKNKILILNDAISNYNFADSQNVIILIYGKDTGDNKIDILLNHRAQSVLSDVLKNDMNVSSKKISQLAHFAKNNVFLIARELENESSHITNPWRNRSDLPSLIPILMLGKINVKNKADKDILSSFLMNGENVDQYIAQIKKWENIDNSPILIYGDYIKVSLKEELWCSIEKNITEQTELTLFENIKTIFSTYNPKYDLPKEQQFAHQIYNKTWKYNKYIIEGLLDSCILLAIYNNKQNEIDILFNQILEGISSKEKVLTIADFMKLIAECSPEKFISYIEKEIKKDNSLIWELFANNDIDLLIGGGHEYCNLLWALEMLCKFDKYKIRACNILLQLAKKNFSYKISNTPAETLESLLWLHNNKNALSIEEKLLFIEQNIEKHGKVFIPYAIKIIFKTSGFLSDSSIKWRDPELKDEELTYPILYNSIDRVVEATLNKIEYYDISIIKSLIDKYLFMPCNTFEKIIKYITETYSKNTSEATCLYEHLLIKRYSAIKYHKETAPQFIEIINPIISQFKPTNEMEASLIYFKHFGYNDCPILETIDNDFEKEEHATRKFQHELLDNLLSNYEHNSVLKQIVGVLPNNGRDGDFLSDFNLSAEDKNFVIVELLKLKKYHALSNLIPSYTDKEKNLFIDGLECQVLKELIPFIQNGDFVPERILKSEELTKLFYRHRYINERRTPSELSLIKKYNPAAYFQWVLYEQKEENWDMQEIISVMCNINKDNISPSNCTLIEEILLKLDNNYYNDDIVRLEFAFLPIFGGKELPNGIRKYFLNNPGEYLSVVEAKNEDKFSRQIKYEIIRHMSFPNDFTTQQIMSFINVLLRNASGDSIRDKAIRQHLGEIIARSYVHTKNEYLPLSLKQLLETINDLEVNRGVYIGYENSRGVRTVTDGSPELEQALKLEAEAQSCEIAFPAAASVLRMIARSRRNDAAQDKEERLIIDGIL